jgi:hypothetical protein
MNEKTIHDVQKVLRKDSKKIRTKVSFIYIIMARCWSLSLWCLFHMPPDFQYVDAPPLGWASSEKMVCFAVSGHVAYFGQDSSCSDAAKAGQVQMRCNFCFFKSNN